MKNPFNHKDVLTMDEIKEYKKHIKNKKYMKKIDALIEDMGWSNDLIKKSYFLQYVLELKDCEGELANTNPENYINITYCGVNYLAI